jgi:hypothetical protein
MEEKGLRSPCEQVIEWRVNQPDCSDAEERTLRAIQDHGVTEPRQEELLATACKASGMREVCEHADEC